MVVAFLFQQYVMKTNHINFLLGIIAFFLSFSLIVHQLAQNASKSKNKFVFTRLTLAISFVKMLLIVVIVVGYRLLISRESIEFIWPFLIIYLIFTIFETSYLTKLAKL